MKSLNSTGLWARGSWYVLRNALGPIINTFLFTVLLLESVRLKLVWNVAVHQTHPFWAIGKYLGQWLPLYSALGLQVALAVGTMMGFTKISRSRELDALHAVGFSMLQLMAPLLGLTTVFATICFFIFGWLQPLSLYDSGLFIHEVQMTASLLTDGQNLFRVEGNKTIIVDGIARDGRGFGKVFIYETYPTGDSTTRQVQLAKL